VEQAVAETPQIHQQQAPQILVVEVVVDCKLQTLLERQVAQV
jgi:hypothetical protein